VQYPLLRLNPAATVLPSLNPDGEDSRNSQRLGRQCCTACFKSKLSKLVNACEQAIMEGWELQGDCL
jgi:hypothetical protein